MKIKYVFLVIQLLCTGFLLRAQITYTGKQPGKSVSVQRSGQVILENEVLGLNFRKTSQSLSVASFRDKVTGQVLDLPANTPIFSFTLADGTNWTSNDFVVKGKISFSDILTKPTANRKAETIPGKKLSAQFENAKIGLSINWEAELRNGSNYVRQVFSFSPESPVDITRFDLITLPASVKLEKIGTVDGSPMAHENMFFAVEHPLSKIEQGATSSVAFLPRSLPLVADSSYVITSVWGVTPDKQLRRGFLYYLERERANPYHQFLHYNSWYDLSFADRVLNDSLCLDRIKVFGDSLITKRNTPMQAFLFDDGWDDYKTLWQFNQGFPNGFTNLRNAALKYGAGIGVWMSPWGGYDIRKPQRLEYGAKQNPPFETNENGFSLAGPVYYKRFSDVTSNFIRKYNVSIFKFDGVGAGNGTSGVTGQYQRDMEALIHLINGLRTTKPDLFLSLTIGTWPSVYWLNYGDVIWRAGDDTGLEGKGPKRQQWMNYRDAQTYQNVVKRAPLYPLSSLMYHGLCIADQGIPGKLEMTDKDIADEIWSFFATGTSLQEMYVNPHKLNSNNWDCLQKAINWARGKRNLMADVHWIGGDPAKEEVYGYAAWSSEGAYVTLRNPSEEPKTFRVNAKEVFDLPAAVNPSFNFYDTRAEAGDNKKHLVASGSSFEITLQPFEFKILDAQPVK